MTAVAVDVNSSFINNAQIILWQKSLSEFLPYFKYYSARNASIFLFGVRKWGSFVLTDFQFPFS